MKIKDYWAFISYSSKDRKWGKWLHHKLESYPIPPEYENKKVFDGAVLGKNLRPVFRDRDELAGSSELGPAILDALDNSRFLIVLCSPNSAQSQWVNKEIEDFKSLTEGNEKRILALILDGEPNAFQAAELDDARECFPPALRYPLEPLAGDLRREGDGKERGFLKVLAGITQLNFDSLYRRHERAQQKKYLILGCVAVTIIALLTALSIFAVSQSKRADLETKKVTDEKKAQALLLSNIADSDHNSALLSLKRKQYLEAAAYYARALTISPENSATASSAISSMLINKNFFARERFVLKLPYAAHSFRINQSNMLFFRSGSKLHQLNLNSGTLTELKQTPFSQALQGISVEIDHSPVTVRCSNMALPYDYVGTEKGKIQKLDRASQIDLWKALPNQRKNYIAHLAVEPSGLLLAVADWDSTLSIISTVNGKVLDTIQFDSSINFLGYSNDSKYLIVGTSTNLIRIFDTGDTRITRYSAPKKMLENSSSNSSDNGIKNTSYVDPETGQVLVADLELTAKPIHSVLSPDKKYLLIATDDNKLHHYQTKSDTRRTRSFSGKIRDICINHSNIALIGLNNRDLVAFQLESSTLLWKARFEGHVNDLSLSADGKLVAVASDDFSCKIYDIHSGRNVWSTFANGCVNSVEFSRSIPHQLSYSTDSTHYTTQCPHLFHSIKDSNSALSAHLKKQSSYSLIKISNRVSANAERDPHIEKILKWKMSPLSLRTNTPYSDECISTVLLADLPSASKEVAELYFHQTPWHALNLASFARFQEEDLQRQHLFKLAAIRLNLLKDTSMEEHRQIGMLMAQWMIKSGFTELATELLTAQLQKNPGHQPTQDLLLSIPK